MDKNAQVILAWGFVIFIFLGLIMVGTVAEKYVNTLAPCKEQTK